MTCPLLDLLGIVTDLWSFSMILFGPPEVHSCRSSFIVRRVCPLIRLPVYWRVLGRQGRKGQDRRADTSYHQDRVVCQTFMRMWFMSEVIAGNRGEKQNGEPNVLLVPRKTKGPSFYVSYWRHYVVESFMAKGLSVPGLLTQRDGVSHCVFCLLGVTFTHECFRVGEWIYSSLKVT